jgi:hypothetical protein
VLVSSLEQDPGTKGVETTLGLNFGNIKLTDQPVTKGKLGAPETASFDLTTVKTAAALSPSDVLFNQTTLSQTSLMAPANAGSAGSQDSSLHPTLAGTSS